ncbi:tryptophan synthase beta subunit-like PLP-dependent enzyme [Chytridium lagenaria]|nr:tryptophan synthase beta subunit-like PLP-dependent enzyme [Chytridium lagenaria]
MSFIVQKKSAESGIPDDDLLDILKRSFATFSHPDVTPVKDLPVVPTSSSDAKPNHLHVLELFHGPTFAFKDVALQVLGNLFEYFLARKNRRASPGEPVHRINVLGATSGDTGGAAIYGLRGKKNVNVFILHPKHRISPVQEQQMTSVLDGNVHNVALDGSTFDDCQETVKILFGDREFKQKYKLGAINSINWARILAQTSYYFASYLHFCKSHIKRDTTKGATPTDLPKVQYSVPTGNFGDILAGYYSVAWTGAYTKPTSPTSTTTADDVKMTLSPAMDILVSSNFERLLWYLARGDSITSTPDLTASSTASRAISTWMQHLRTGNGFTVPSNVHALSKEIFTSRRVTDAQTTDAIRRYFVLPENRYVLDPHTAVGVVAAEEVLAGLEESEREGVVTCVLATASPGKFPDAVDEAVKGFAGLKYEDFAPKALVEQKDVFTGGDKALALKFVRKVVVETVGDEF